jgi:oligosaccharide translocation protein RFT1
MYRLGSLVARILFQPLEETSRLFFSRTLSTPTSPSLLSAAQLLSSLLLLHTHLSLIFILLAPSYTSPILFHLLGPRWSFPLSSAPLILRAYCFYLPFLAINGITEAFFQSVATGDWLRRGSVWMGVCSIGFVGAVTVGMKMGNGETALIYANCLNMSMRIGFSSWFIGSYFARATKEVGMEKEDEKGIKDALRWSAWTPKVGTVATFVLSWFAVNWSEQRWDWKQPRGLVSHLGVGATMGLFCLLVM